MDKAAYKYVLKLLSRRDYSSEELRIRLVERQYSNDEIKKILFYCHEHNWLNDERFAESLLRQKAAKGYGWQRICADARKKGIDHTLLQKAQDEQQHDWFYLAKKLATKRFGDLNGVILSVDQKTKAKRQRFLLQRGFNRDEINYALDSEN